MTPRHPGHAPETLDPEAETPAVKARNIVDLERELAELKAEARPISDEVQISAKGSGKAWGKLLAAVLMTLVSVAGGLAGHRVGASEAESRIAALEKALAEHIAAAALDNRARDNDIALVRTDISVIRQAMSDMRDDVRDLKVTLQLAPAVQPRSRPVGARPRVPSP